MDLDTLLGQLKTMGEEADPGIMAVIRGYGAAAVEPLLAIAIDPELNLGETESAEVWAPIHAIELLATLPIDERIVARLIDLLDEYPDDDWLAETLMRDLPHAGEVILEPALAVLRNRARDVYTRNAMAEMLEYLVKEHADLNERVADSVVAIMSAMDPADETDHDRVVNAFMLGALGATRQQQYMPFVKQMFAEERVDESVTDLDWVLDSLVGLDPMIRHQASPEYARFQEFLSRFGIETAEQPEPFQDWEEQGSGTYIAPKKPGRNDPCWCGSGKKYKKCHMRGDEERERKNRQERR